jgi:hypothetical protein
VFVALHGAQETQNYMTLPKWYLDCDKCRAHADSEPFLLEAFASVGIEHGKSSGQMAEEYFVHFHRNGHKAEGPKVLKPE